MRVRLLRSLASESSAVACFCLILWGPSLAWDSVMPFYPGIPDPYRAWDAPGPPAHTQSLLLLSLQLLSEAALSTDLTAPRLQSGSHLFYACVRTQVYTHMFTGVPTDVCA